MTHHQLTRSLARSRRPQDCVIPFRNPSFSLYCQRNMTAVRWQQS